MSDSNSGSHSSSKRDRAASCTIVTDTFSEVTNQPCGSKVTYYQAFTDPLPTVEMQFFNSSVSCKMTVIIKRGHGSTIERTLDPALNRFFQAIVSDVESISLRCQDGISPCTGSINLVIRYSVCC
jgi:hypothetical protein